MNNDCNGCKAYRKINIELFSCKYTRVTVRDIPLCPCKICLVKVTCDSICSDLIQRVNSKDIILSTPYQYMNLIVGLRKESIRESGPSMSSSSSVPYPKIDLKVYTRRINTIPRKMQSIKTKGL